jgi:hypothetical protein
LVTAEDLAQAALGGIAAHSRPDGGDRGHHTHAHHGRSRDWSGGIATAPPQGEGTAVDAAALFTETAEIVLAPQTLFSAQVHQGKRNRR